MVHVQLVVQAVPTCLLVNSSYLEGLGFGHTTHAVRLFPYRGALFTGLGVCFSEGVAGRKIRSSSPYMKDEIDGLGRKAEILLKAVVRSMPRRAETEFTHRNSGVWRSAPAIKQACCNTCTGGDDPVLASPSFRYLLICTPRAQDSPTRTGCHEPAQQSTTAADANAAPPPPPPNHRSPDRGRVSPRPNPNPNLLAFLSCPSASVLLPFSPVMAKRLVAFQSPQNEA